ncbi:MAG: RDD family protein [Hydrococcus sp. C42_A2020_068]|nr:RDD family protein [Hydrococcus sp. C42_A2020_068]
MRFFNRLTLQTPESVELEFTLAGIGNRAYALVVDYIIWGFILIFLLVIWALLSVFISENLSNIYAEQLTLWLTAIQVFIIFAAYVGYFVFFETIWQGQTPGKRFVKIRVICDDGRPVRLQQSTLRALLRPIDDLFFVGAFLIMLSKREKRLGDWIGGTMVIQEDRPTTPTKFFLSNEAQAIANQLLVEADLSRLLPEDFAVIREYLQRRDGMLPKARIELCRKLAERVKNIISLEEVPEGITANLFLEAVYLAYQKRSVSGDWRSGINDW